MPPEPSELKRTMQNVLFLCTGNSCRSIVAEALLNDLRGDEFTAFSAGSRPAGRVNPAALDALTTRGHSVEGLASKSWDDFSGPSAPPLDIVITVCDNAAGESCPLWNGAPLTLHWGLPDPAEVVDPDEQRRAFDYVYERLAGKIRALKAV
jgi:arsenate reductase